MIAYNIMEYRRMKSANTEIALGEMKAKIDIRKSIVLGDQARRMAGEGHPSLSPADPIANEAL